MMYDFIANRANNDRTMLTNKLLGDLTLATKKTEDLLKLIARQSSGDPGSQVEEQINKIERIASLVKSIQNINDPVIFGKEISALSEQAFLEKISNSNDIREFINSLDKFRTIQDRSSKSEFAIRRDIGEGRFRRYSLDSIFIDNLNKSFQQLKKADDDEITMAFNELYEI